MKSTSDPIWNSIDYLWLPCVEWEESGSRIPQPRILNVSPFYCNAPRPLQFPEVLKFAGTLYQFQEILLMKIFNIAFNSF